jgi:hypothetical protein
VGKEMIKYRALYTGDLEDDLYLPFFIKEYRDELVFMMEEPVELENRITYPLSVPFLDEDWLIHRFTGFADSDRVDIYEGDTLTVINGSSEKEYVVIFDSACQALGVLSREESEFISIYSFLKCLKSLQLKVFSRYDLCS